MSGGWGRVHWSRKVLYGNLHGKVCGECLIFCPARGLKIWHFISCTSKSNVLFESKYGTGLSVILLVRKIEESEKKCGQFHKSPSNYSWHRTRTNPAWMISSSRTNWAKIISENHNVSELWKCFQGCPFQKRETFKLMSKSLNAFTISIWHSFQLKSLLTQI